MPRPHHILLSISFLAAVAFAGEPGSLGAERGLAIKAAKVLAVPVEGPQVIDNAVVLIKDGRIEAIGPAATTAVPEGWELIDVGERWLAPGMIDLHNHVAGGLGDLNDMVYLTNPGLRASSTITPLNSYVRRALGGGVTSVLLIPGSGTNVGGQGVLEARPPALRGYRDPQSRLVEAGSGGQPGALPLRRRPLLHELEHAQHLPARRDLRETLGGTRARRR